MGNPCKSNANKKNRSVQENNPNVSGFGFFLHPKTERSTDHAGRKLGYAALNMAAGRRHGKGRFLQPEETGIIIEENDVSASQLSYSGPTHSLYYSYFSRPPPVLSSPTTTAPTPTCASAFAERKELATAFSNGVWSGGCCISDGC